MPPSPAQQTSRITPIRLQKRASFTCAAVLLALTVAACTGHDGRQTGSSLGTDQEKRARIETMYEGYNLPLTPDAEIAPRELAALQEEGAVVIVDVREAEERAVSMIPGSISKEHYESNAEEYRGQSVIAYCTIGYRSGRYVETLRSRGVDAKNLKGSLLAWTHAGLPMVDEQGKQVKRAHVYGAEWDLLPEGFEAVW